MSQNRWIVQLSESGHVMGWVVVTLVLFCAPCVIAQTGIMSQPPPEMGFTLDPKIKVSPSMAIILVCLISAFFLMGCVSVYVRHCAERHMSFPVVDTEPGGSQRSRRASARGLDPAEIDAVPMFLYSDVKGHKIGKVALECAVCLNEFEDDETLRLLPKCSHVFHPDCIDAWLSSHVTCPVCRSNLLPPPGETRPVRVLSQDPYDSDDSSRLNDSVRAVDDFTIDVDPPEAINPSQTPNQNRPPRWPPSKLRSSGRFPRSHSVGHTVVEPGENCERFTLRLPEEVRSRLVTSSSSLSRTRSCVAFPRARSTRKGYRSSSTGGGGRGKYYERFDREGPSDRWGFTMTPPFFSRAGSARSPKVGGADDLTATPRSISRSVKSPFDRLFGGTDKDNRGERSFDRLKTDGQS